jgi:hypothetical protein
MAERFAKVRLEMNAEQNEAGMRPAALLRFRLVGAFSTAWPVAFTSLPAPATVLHAVSEETDRESRITSSAF